jgi:recombination protein RecA
MAKKTTQKKAIKTDLSKMMDQVRKVTESTNFTNSAYGEISSFISTGSYALNRIISGDVYGGIPQGRSILFGGESGVGKSLIAAKIIKNALDDGFKHVFYFDSEGGGLKAFFENMGCDLDRIEHILVNTVEETTVKVLKLYEALEEHKKNNPDDQFLIILDSLGNLVTEKFYTDAQDKSKQVTDMGLRARACNGLMQSTTIPALKTDTTFIAINHVYDDPSAMHPSKIKNQSGGKKLQYVATITIQCTKGLSSKDKDESEDKAFYKGAELRFFTVKNRLVKPFLDATMYIDFAKGINKWDGLLEPAIAYGFINQAGAWYSNPNYMDGKKFPKATLLKEDAFWESFLDDFNEESKKKLAYSSASDIDEMEEEELGDGSDDISFDNVNLDN